MKSNLLIRGLFCSLILFLMTVGCQKDRSQLVENGKENSLENVKELYSKQKIFTKINPKDNLPVQWEPLWDEATVKKTNDSVEYLFIPLHPFLKSDKKQKSEERGAKTYLLVKNGAEFYTGIYYGNSKEEIVDIWTFSGKMLFTNLKDGSSNLIKYRNGSPYFDENANIQKKGASSTKMGWEQQNCRTEIKDCAFRLLDYSCMGQLIVVRSMDCSYPGFCTQYYWDMIDSNEVITCDNVWVPDAPDGGDGGGYTPSEEDKEIIDSLQGYPCAQAVLVKIPNLQNKISEWLNKEFNKTSSSGERIFNIKFNASLQLGPDVDGQHIAYQTSAKEVHTITLNGNMLKTASQEYIAVTMFHEALHAFLASERLRLKALNQENQFPILYPGWTAYTIGGQVKYANNHNNFGTLLADLKTALKSFNPSLTESEASALSKGGVVTSMTQAEIDVNKNHKDGKTGTKCTP